MTRIYLALGGAVAGLLLLIGAYFFGRHDGKVAERSDYLGAELKQRDAELIEAKKFHESDVAAATQDTHTDTVIREITREIPKIIAGDIVYRNVCINAAGVQSIFDTLDAINGTASSGANGGSQGAAPAKANDVSR